MRPTLLLLLTILAVNHVESWDWWDDFWNAGKTGFNFLSGDPKFFKNFLLTGNPVQRKSKGTQRLQSFQRILADKSGVGAQVGLLGLLTTANGGLCYFTMHLLGIKF